MRRRPSPERRRKRSPRSGARSGLSGRADALPDDALFAQGRQHRPERIRADAAPADLLQERACSRSAPISFTADGQPVPGVLEAGSVQAPQSTITFRPSSTLLAGALLRIDLTSALTTLDGDPLVSPFALEFRSADAPGDRPILSQVVPRVGPVMGGEFADLLGANFEAGSTVLFGGSPATVVSTSSTRLVVVVPPGQYGLRTSRW